MARRRNIQKCRGQKRKRSPVQQPSKIGWSDLPLEVREMILEALEDSLQGGKAASYASVSKEWNRILEPYIFKRLKLLPPYSLEGFQYFITDRCRPFVQFIWFQFQRDCRPDWGNTDFEEQKRLDQLQFAYAVYCLFQILSEWGERKAGQPGIVLELSAFSSSDPRYSMKDTVPKELENVNIKEDSDALNAVYEKSAVRQTRKLSVEDMIYRKNSHLEFMYEASSFPLVVEAPFPTVNLVTDLTVRRQIHSSFFAQYMGRLVKALPRLEFITFEPVYDSADWELGWFPYSSLEPMKKILNAMPSSIRRLQVFEDDISLYDRHRPRRWVDRHALGQLAAKVSQDKEPEVLAMSFIIDASDFFGDFYSDFPAPEIARRPGEKVGWAKLTSLTLTSSNFNPHPSGVPSLLMAAARAARHMPSLAIMELYNAGFGYGGIFTYIHDEEGSIIQWESTWKWELPSDVIDIWRMTARVHGTEILEHNSGRITSRDLGWPARIISLLRTRETVVHPFTYCNMMNGLNHR
ncbi:hypothetical protein TGAM01_v205616 [Trichoderma gamsii]|uniref:DUF6546 domain-containing protein n=1 Tax=Trichoderma gamsii TaxID=398673 RepID=A0A2P4ZLZ2_9HYPO|nr:hypothetical protein TGAM01_v205616 [Trichoderma gamsii]PON25322.1 hypothetical protein TGAM01_v205616 [Trichoderma gamsii]